MSAAIAPPPRAALIDSFISLDHKAIARRLLVFSLLFFLAGGVMALLMRTELAEPGLQVVSTETYNALFTMHGSTMIYLVITPLSLALGLYMVPLQVGSSRVAAPRVALCGLWLFVLGGIVMESGWLTVGGPGRATWIGVAPLSELQHTPGAGQDFWIIGVLLATLGEWLIGMCILATALGRRTPGMTLMRMPPFTWTMVGTTLMMIFAFPVLIVLMGLLFYDRRNCCLFDGPQGPLNYQELFWFYGHPVVYVMFFPFVGAVAEVFSAFSGRRLFGYAFFVASTALLFAALSSSVWGHHMFTTGRIDVKYFAVTSHAIILAAGLEYFDLIGTLWRGRIRFTVPLLFGVVFLFQFLVGGLSGVWVAAPTLDFNANNSYVIVAHFHYTLFAGSLFGAFAAIFYWFPKWTGALLREGLGRVQLALLFVGTNMTFAPMFALGEDGMTRRIANYSAASGWETLNTIATIGSYLIALGVLVFLINLYVSLRRRRVAGADPWGGPSLEWATSSPPPPTNFEALPPVRSFAPLMDARAEVTR
ncbi:MAG TPA: cbb3-type cytochrome c oxidase subunit I [Baekduia sp.]